MEVSLVVVGRGQPYAYPHRYTFNNDLQVRCVTHNICNVFLTVMGIGWLQIGVYLLCNGNNGIQE